MGIWENTAESPPTRRATALAALAAAGGGGNDHTSQAESFMQDMSAMLVRLGVPPEILNLERFDF